MSAETKQAAAREAALVYGSSLRERRSAPYNVKRLEELEAKARAICEGKVPDGGQ